MRNVNQQFYPLTRWIGTTNFSDDYVDPTGQDTFFASRSVPRASNGFTIPTANGPVTLSVSKLHPNSGRCYPAPAKPQYAS